MSSRIDLSQARSTTRSDLEGLKLLNEARLLDARIFGRNAAAIIALTLWPALLIAAYRWAVGV